MPIIPRRPEVSRIYALSCLILQSGALFVCDTHMNLDPTAAQVAEMTGLAADAVRAFGIVPKAALLSHSSFGSSKSDSARRMRQALALIRAARPELEVDGEMHPDAALIETLRDRAVPDSRLHGTANLLVMPNLDAANIGFNLLKAGADGLADRADPAGHEQADPCRRAQRDGARHCQHQRRRLDGGGPRAGGAAGVRAGGLRRVTAGAMIPVAAGLAALAVLLWAAQAFARARVANLKTLLGWVAALAGLALAAGLLLTGRGASALLAAVLLGPLAISWWQEGKLPRPRPGPRKAGRDQARADVADGGAGGAGAAGPGVGRRRAGGLDSADARGAPRQRRLRLAGGAGEPGAGHVAQRALSGV